MCNTLQAIGLSIYCNCEKVIACICVWPANDYYIYLVSKQITIENLTWNTRDDAMIAMKEAFGLC